MIILPSTLEAARMGGGLLAWGGELEHDVAPGGGPGVPVDYTL